MQLGYVILYVPDVPAAIAFYEKAFGLRRRFLDEGGQYGEMETGGTALAFASETIVAAIGCDYRPNRRSDPAAGAEIGFVTADVAGDFRRAVEAGAIPVLEPTKKPWGQIVSYVRDSQGFLVEICSAVPS